MIWDYDAAFRGAAFTGNEVVNRPDSRSNHFHTVEFTLAKRASAKWSAQTSYLITKNYAYAVGVPTSPNDDYYPIDRTLNWVYKVNGSYTFPKDLVFSGRAAQALRLWIIWMRQLLPTKPFTSARR